MGIATECWRARIGMYRCTQKTPVLMNSSKDAVFWHGLALFLVLVTLLTVGNVEVNPGPVFKCSRCSTSSQTLIQDAAHQRMHQHDFNFTFKCSWPTCQHPVPSYEGLLSHIRRSEHEGSGSVTPQQQPPSTLSLKCKVGLCDFKCLSFKELCEHVLNSHFSKEGSAATDDILCPFTDCQRSVSFKSKKLLYSHLGQSHKGWRTTIAEASPSQYLPLQNLDSAYEMDTGGDRCSDPVHLEPAQNESLYSGDVPAHSDEVAFMYIAKFYLYLEGELMLPSSTVQKISEHLITLSEVIHSSVRSALVNELNLHGLSKEDIVNLSSKILAADPLFASHHKDCIGPSFSSVFLRQEYYKKNFVYVEPVEYFPGEDRIDGKAVQYSPIQESLKLMLNDPSVQQEVLQSFTEERSNEYLYQSYTDGEVCKNKNSHVKERIDLFLFTDGFSVTNPLGSAKKKHRLEGTYFTLGNLKSHSRSKLDAMHLVSMISKDLLKQHGYEKCYKPLISELQQLQEDGIDFQGKKIPVVVMFVIGDNLGQHQLGGFVESFSSSYFCRFCSITRNEFQQDPLRSGSFRTPSHYDMCVKKSMFKKSGSFKGIKFNSILNQLRNFHVCDPRLAVCVAHDLFHGVVSWDLSVFIKYFIEKKKWFSYTLLNRRIQKFQCKDGDAGNKPAAVNVSGDKLGGHAVQNWTLLRILPFVIGDKIQNTSDQVWSLYLKLKAICEIICAPIISVDQVHVLRRYLYEYMSAVKSLVKIRPKHHFMLHYPDLIGQFGPLIHLSTLRFESKHAFFKRIVRATNNFINVPRTLILRHQLHLAYLSTGQLLSNNIKNVKNSQALDLSKLSPEVASSIKEENLDPSSTACNSVNVGNLHYKIGQWLITSITSSEIEISEIKAIILSGSDVVFSVAKHLSVFLPSYGVYKIERNIQTFECVKQKDMSHPTVQPVYDFKDDLCFSLKCALH